MLRTANQASLLRCQPCRWPVLASRRYRGGCRSAGRAGLSFDLSARWIHCGSGAGHGSKWRATAWSHVRQSIVQRHRRHVARVESSLRRQPYTSSLRGDDAKLQATDTTRGTATGAGTETASPAEVAANQEFNQSTKPVIAAIVGNSFVCAGKATAALLTGSGVMMAEAFHSLADVANQFLLWIGIQRARQPPTEQYPYGYAPLKPAYALVSATGVFFLGCGASMYRGISDLCFDTVHELDHLGIAFGVLGGSFLVEGATLYYAYKSVKKIARKNDMGLLQYVKHGRDTTSIAVLVEDFAAVSGIGVAATCLGLSAYTNNPVYDSVGTLAVGASLGWVAMFLIKRNMEVLAGRSMDPHQRKLIVDILNENPTIHSVHDIKTQTWGGNSGRFKAEIAYNGRELSKKYMRYLDAGKVGPGRQLLALVDNCDCSGLTQDQRRQLVLNFGDGVVNELAKEVDRVESKIAQAVGVQISHLDLESHARVADELWKEQISVPNVAIRRQPDEPPACSK